MSTVEPAPTIAKLRQWFPASRWDDQAVQAAIDAGSTETDFLVERARLYLLRQLYGQLLHDPTKWTANGDYSEDRTAQMKALKAEIGDLEAVIGEGPHANGIDPKVPTLQATSMFRPDQENTFVQETASTQPGIDGERSLYSGRHTRW